MAEYVSGMSSSDMMKSVMFAKLNGANGSEESFNKVVTVSVATDSITGIANASNEMTRSTVDNLKELKELGYDKADTVILEMVNATTSIRKVLVTISETIPRLLR